MLGVPSANKWTKLGPALDFDFIGNSGGAVLCMLLEYAFDSFDVAPLRKPTGGRAIADGVVDADAAVDDPDVESAIKEEIHWHKMNGRRAGRIKRAQRDLAARVRKAILAVIMEPLLWLAIIILRSSTERMEWENTPCWQTQ